MVSHPELTADQFPYVDGWYPILVTAPEILRGWMVNYNIYSGHMSYSVYLDAVKRSWSWHQKLQEEEGEL